MKIKTKHLVLFTAALIIIFASAGCKKAADLAPSAIPAAVSAPVYPLVVLIDDCDDNDNINALGGMWFTYDDTKAPNFGVSKVIPANGALYTMAPIGPDWDTTKNGPNAYAAEMSGQVIEWTKPYVAFVGEGIQLGPTENPQNFTNFTGIRFWAKVGPTDQIGPYRISFKVPISVNPDPATYDYFGIIFTPTTTWKQYDFKFTAFSLSFGSTPPGYTLITYRTACMSNVMDIQLQTKNNIPATPTKGKTYNVDFWVDKIELYR